MSEEGMITVRLPRKDIEVLDKHSKGQLSRAGILRLLVQNFLKKPHEEQRQFLMDELFGE